MLTLSLDIQVIPQGNNASLFINGQRYMINTAIMDSVDDLFKLMHDQPDYVQDAVVGLLQEAVL